MDTFTPQKRSEIMRRIGPKGSVPERLLRSMVHRMGYRFRLHGRDLPGTPDIVLPKHHKVVFMNSCFFHGHTACNRGQSRPSTNAERWAAKIEGNRRRDIRDHRRLRKMGWDYLVIWQCEIKKGNEDRLESKIRRFLEE
jgi:DNA mismatch endonuclease, patch repair protein